MVLSACWLAVVEPVTEAISSAVISWEDSSLSLIRISAKPVKDITLDWEERGSLWVGLLWAGLFWWVRVDFGVSCSKIRLATEPSSMEDRLVVGSCCCCCCCCCGGGGGEDVVGVSSTL